MTKELLFNQLAYFIFEVPIMTPKAEKNMADQLDLAYQALTHNKLAVARGHLMQLHQIASGSQTGGMKRLQQWLRRSNPKVGFIGPAPSPNRSPTETPRSSPDSSLVSSPDETPRSSPDSLLGSSPNEIRASMGALDTNPRADDNYGTVQPSELDQVPSDLYQVPPVSLRMPYGNSIAVNEPELRAYYLDMNADQAAEYLSLNPKVPFILRPLSAQAQKQQLDHARPFVSVSFWDKNTLDKALIYQTPDVQYTTDGIEKFPTLLELLARYGIVDFGRFLKSVQSLPTASEQPYRRISKVVTPSGTYGELKYVMGSYDAPNDLLNPMHEESRNSEPMDIDNESVE